MLCVFREYIITSRFLTFPSNSNFFFSVQLLRTSLAARNTLVSSKHLYTLDSFPFFFFFVKLFFTHPHNKRQNRIYTSSFIVAAFPT